MSVALSNSLSDLARQSVIRTHPLQVHSVVMRGAAVHISMSVATAGARCPRCHHVSCRVHSRYVRQPSDLAWGSLPVRLQLTVRRFHCDTPGCVRRIFAEQLPDFLRRYARRTEQLDEQLLWLAWVAGGEAGASLARRFKIAVSGDTLLRLTRRYGVPMRETPRVLGVDDWAFRRGQRYGTILCDLERHWVVDLLPDREAQTLADWLSTHPGVEFISRDRATAYADGARRGAPQAIQIADRWHLLKNLGEVVKRVVLRRRGSLQRLLDPHTADQSIVTPMSHKLLDAPSQTPQGRARNKLTREQQTHLVRDQHYRQRYERVHALRGEGHSIMAIHRQTKLDPRTIRKLLAQADYAGVPRRGNNDSSVSPFADYLTQRWQQGCQLVTVLYDEIRTRGYTGSYNAVARFVRPWPRHSDALAAAPQWARLPALFEMSKRLTQPEASLEATDREQVAHWCKMDEVLQVARHLSLTFTSMVQQRQADRLDAWLAQAADCEVGEFRAFARSLGRDIDAIRAALTYEWSTGPVEGHVQRLKTIKRQAYGRAKFDLLRIRVMRP
jgi:transposase